MNTCSVARFSRPARLFSFGLLDCKYAYVDLPCEKPRRGFDLERLATAFMNHPG